MAWELLGPPEAAESVKLLIINSFGGQWKGPRGVKFGGVQGGSQHRTCTTHHSGDCLMHQNQVSLLPCKGG
jgi:hypothetical protein